MSDNIPAVKKGRNTAIVQAGLERFADMQEDNDRLAKQVGDLQSQIAAMAATIANIEQQLGVAKEEASRYMRSYTELLTSLNNAVMVLNTAQENARMATDAPSARLVPGQDPDGDAVESARRLVPRGNVKVNNRQGE
jgi:predicted RNase H-like nuclease (RuvC/YqgF family)